MTKWIFLGDDSRFIFISKLLQIPLEEIDEEKTLLIRRGEKIFSREVSGNGSLILSSYFVPPKIEIFLPSYSGEINFDTENFDNCAIFEMFPFGKESTENFARLLKNYQSNLFVMADVEEEEENSPVGLDAIKKIFLKKNRDILIFRDEEDILKILHWHKPLAADIIDLLRSEFHEMYIRVDEFYGEYENFLSEQKINGFLSDAAKNKITAFSVVRGQDHIWMSYKAAALKYFFPAKNLMEFYRRTLYQTENSLASMIWNVAADCAKLNEKLYKKFESLMQTPKNFQSLVNAGEMYSEHMYRVLIRPGGRFAEIDKVFFSVCEKFFQNDAREILFSELNSHYRDLKKLLNDRKLS